jgi:DeoR family transcriptional regulator of aga operon/DeoR family fructose operon transcriptional repressor
VSQQVPDAHEMIPAERRARIVELLRQRAAVRVSSLSDDLRVSEMTIRRDLERLEAEGILTRTHGGAVLKRHILEESQYLDRVSAHADEKRLIAQGAAAVIEPGETVFLSSGTTAAQVLRHVPSDLEARVVTHNVGALAEAQDLRLEVVLVGGRYRPRSNAVAGPLAVEHVNRFRASKMLLGVDGFDLEEGLTTPSIDMASVERAMIARTRGEVIALADRSKIGVVADVAICGFDKVDAVLVDSGVDEAVRDMVGNLGVRCLTV